MSSNPVKAGAPDAPPAAKKKHDPTSFRAVRIRHNTHVPFVGRCGSLLIFVHTLTRIEDTQILLIRGTVIEGMHFADHGDYGPGMECTIGPISSHWRRISTLPKP